MSRQWLVAICSALSLISGFIMVVIFSNNYALPHLVVGNFVPTTCVITALACRRRFIPKAQSLNRTELPAECTRVFASHKTGDDHGHLAAVFEDFWSYFSQKIEVVSNTECFCLDSCSIDCSTPQAAIQVHGYNISRGSHVTCYYNPFNESEVLMTRPSTVVVMNAMIWPSILFIVGFVSLVFSCIKVQKEGCSCSDCQAPTFFCNEQYSTNDTVMVI